MPKFGDLGLKFSKTNIRFEFNTFEIGYTRNFVKVRKLILFGPKCPDLDILGSKFSKINDKFGINTFEIGNMSNFVKIRKSACFGPRCPNLDISARNLKNES